MQATRIVVDHPGGPDVLRPETYDLAEPGEGEALIRHEAIGLNFIDTHHRNGRYKLPAYPSPLGLEAAGIVELVGPGVTSLAPGDRVAYAVMHVGAYADRRVMPADRLLPVPPGIDLRTAAAALNKGLTAHFLCHATHPVQAGETILVHAAAGGVGSMLCQWIRHKGATVIGTVGTPDKRAFAAEAGCHHVLVLSEDDVVQRVREITGGAMLPVVYDAVGPATFELSLHCLAKRGLLVSFGTASGPLPPLDLFRLNRLGSLYVTSPGFADHTADPEEYRARGRDVFEALAAGIIRVPVNQTFALADAAKAHTALQARRTIGASVLIP